MRIMLPALLGIGAMAAAYAQPAPPPGPGHQGRPMADAALINRGRYLATISGCNDCHTPGFMLSAGRVPEPLWLTGDNLGWNGPWGTTYAPNLRLFVNGMAEGEWIDFARHKVLRPPMPWFDLRAMSTRDLRAIYHYIRFLGPAGRPAPDALPPGVEPKGPVVRFPAPPPH